MAGADLLEVLRGGFSADTLRRLTDRCPESDAGAVFPVPLLVVEYISYMLAERWENRAIEVAEFEQGRATFEEPMRRLLDAMVRGDAPEVAEASNRLAQIFMQFRA